VASLILALRFLTVVPVPGAAAAAPGALGRAAWWFPPVGLALGAVLALADAGLGPLFPPLLRAAAVVALWKGLTGALHLDGLADCLDGLAGRDPADRRRIMRDSRVGVFGAVGLVLALLLSVAAVDAVTRGPAAWRVLLLAPLAGRIAPLLVATPGSAAAEGLGASSARARPAAAGVLAAALSAALAAILLGPPGLLVLSVGLAVGWLIARALARGLGGVTGDVLGASVELAELGVLAAAVACARRTWI
jgi:adenosylcobinamide-GDP ribazoletransferase